MRSHDILSFFPTLGRVNVQNSEFINLTSRAKRFHPTPVPAWIPQFLTVALQLQLHAARTDLSAPLGEAGKSSQGWKDKCLSFKLKTALPRALFRFPSVSFAERRLPWNSQRSCFFFFIFYYFCSYPNSSAAAYTPLWHFCVFCGVLHFCWLFIE